MTNNPTQAEPVEGLASIPNSVWHEVDEVLVPFRAASTPREWARYADQLRGALAEKVLALTQSAEREQRLIALLRRCLPHVETAHGIADAGGYPAATETACLLSAVRQALNNGGSDE